MSSCHLFTPIHPISYACTYMGALLYRVKIGTTDVEISVFSVSPKDGQWCVFCSSTFWLKGIFYGGIFCLLKVIDVSLLSSSNEGETSSWALYCQSTLLSSWGRKSHNKQTHVHKNPSQMIVMLMMTIITRIFPHNPFKYMHFTSYMQNKGSLTTKIKHFTQGNTAK